MVHLRPVFERSKACKSLLPAGVELLEQAFQTSETLGFGCVLEGLVLRQDVDEAFADVVAMLQQELLALVAKGGEDVPDLALGGELAVRHSPAPLRSGRSRGVRAIAPAHRPAPPRCR